MRLSRSATGYRMAEQQINRRLAAILAADVKKMGDGALVEFGSVVDAVECAVAIQRAMSKCNLASERPVECRIGINLGDIVIEGDDIFGDGVNVAVTTSQELLGMNTRCPARLAEA